MRTHSLSASASFVDNLNRVYPEMVSLSIYLYISIHIYLSIYLSINQSINLFIYLSIYTYICSPLA